MVHGPDIGPVGLRADYRLTHLSGPPSTQLGGSTLGIDKPTRHYTGIMELTNVPQTYPWHSIKESVHHNNTRCGPGSEIPRHNRLSGTGNKPLCRDCRALNTAGK